VEGHDESESLVTRSRWEGVDGRQNVRAKGRWYVLCWDDVSDRRVWANLVSLPAFVTSLPQEYLHSRRAGA